MKNQLKTLLALAVMLLFPFHAFAVSVPTVESHLLNKSGTLATLKIRTEAGAKITVVGGPTDIPPVTDGDGKDPADGYVEVLVGVSAEQKNSYSITAQKDAEVSEAAVYVIDTTPQQQGSVSQEPPSSVGDVTPPPAPKVDTVSLVYYGTKIELTGSSEALANIYVRNSRAEVIGTTQASEAGVFRVKADLEVGKTNRLNVSAEDSAGNEGSPTPITIRVPGPTPPESGEQTQSSAPPAAEEYVSSFDDLRAHWAKSYVDALAKEGIVSGKAARVFDPNGLITRAELVKIALRAFGYRIDVDQKETPFRDVNADDWFAPYVRVAFREGIVAGVNGFFNPNQPVTRAAALKIILEASEISLGAGLVTFSDVPRDAWYMRYIAYAKKNQIVGGYGDGTFRPESPITRAEAAKIVIRVREVKNQK